MEIVPIKISLYEAIESRVKRSQMITLKDIDRYKEIEKKTMFDAYLLKPHYYRELASAEKKLNKKAIDFTLKEKEIFEKMFTEKYYKNNKVKI
ncbi:MAG: hypothetical protein ACRCX2_37740 [Paraclostridium sp.]